MKYPEHIPHRVESSKPEKQNISLEDFPDEFSEGTRNCFDCKNFVVNLKKFRFYSTNDKRYNALPKEQKKCCFMRCKKRLLLVNDGCRGPSEAAIREPAYLVSPANMSKINNGWRDKDWNFANRCEEFEDMRA